MHPSGAAVILLVTSAACADDTPAREPSRARPIDEPRAQEVIGRTFQSESVDPQAARTFTLAPGKPMKLEVAASGHKYGVLWLTRSMARELTSFVPKHENDDGALVVLNGIGADADVHALVLWETDYVTDDLEGVSHASTEIAAERKLERDVRDFLVKAKSERWP